MRDIIEAVEVLKRHRGVCVHGRDSRQEYYDSLRPCGEAAVVKGDISRLDGIIRGLDIAIEALTPEEGK